MRQGDWPRSPPKDLSEVRRAERNSFHHGRDSHIKQNRTSVIRMCVLYIIYIQHITHSLTERQKTLLWVGLKFRFLHNQESLCTRVGTLNRGPAACHQQPCEHPGPSPPDGHGSVEGPPPHRKGAPKWQRKLACNYRWTAACSDGYLSCLCLCLWLIIISII